jgi:hypothetical protein
VGDAPAQAGRGWVWSALMLIVGMMIFGALAGAVFSDRGIVNPTREPGYTAASINPPRAATDDEIRYIRQVFQRIESGTSTVRAVSVPVGRFAARAWPAADSVSAQVYGDPQGEGKIRLRVFDGQIWTSLLFYYHLGNLVFVHQLRGWTGFGADAEHRYYFLERAMIRWRDEYNQIVPVGPAYAEKAQVLLGISDNLLQALTRQ